MKYFLLFCILVLFNSSAHAADETVVSVIPEVFKSIRTFLSALAQAAKSNVNMIAGVGVLFGGLMGGGIQGRIFAAVGAGAAGYILVMLFALLVVTP